jgi:dolichol-phosphate mannosyltransferase
MTLRVVAAPVAFDEGPKIGRVLDRFPAGVVDEVIVVDDGSADRTALEIAARGVRVLRHDTRRGVGAAIRTAIHWSRANGFDVLVIVAGNDKDRPHEIPRLLQPIAEQACAFVQGSRYLPGGAFGNMPGYRWLATRLVHPRLFSWITGRRITDSTNGFRAMRLDLFDDPRIDIDQPWLDGYALEPYIFYKAITLGYGVCEVPVTKIYPDAAVGYTKMQPVTGWWQMLSPLLFLATGLKR